VAEQPVRVAVLLLEPLQVVVVQAVLLAQQILVAAVVAQGLQQILAELAVQV
jgi:hypothetical protein